VLIGRLLDVYTQPTTYPGFGRTIIEIVNWLLGCNDCEAAVNSR
jgi:hypothetical protein